MKTFEEYKFTIRHSDIKIDRKLTKSEMFEDFIIPAIHEESNIYEGEKTVKLPLNANFILFKEPYFGNLHIESIDNFVGMIPGYHIDYEDINPSLVIAGFETLEDAAKYVLENKIKVHDHDDFINNAAEGEISDEEYNGIFKYNGDGDNEIKKSCLKKYFDMINTVGGRNTLKDNNGNILAQNAREVDHYFNDLLKEYYKLNNL